MLEVISKLQFKEFEIGEFFDEKVRAFQECKQIIEEFPWDNERENLKISLTNPSITFHKQIGNYLKLSTSYNQKFVLTYFNESDELYSKFFNHYHESYSFIEEYFEERSFETKYFKKENTFLKNCRQHFITQNFISEVTTNSAIKYLIKTSFISFCLPILIGLIFIFIGYNRFNILGYTSLGFVIFFIGGGLNIILFLNHYLLGKNKKLILSKGKDIFYFGEKQTQTVFKKRHY